MSIEAKLQSIRASRNKIREKLTSFGLATGTDKLEQLATAVDEIIDRGNVSASVKEGESYTILAGYHRGGTVTGVSGGGNYELQTKEATPTKQQQTISPDDGKYGLDKVIISPIPDEYQNVSDVTATAETVLATYMIVDKDGNLVSGTMPNNGVLNLTIDGLNLHSVALQKGYISGGTVSLTDDIENELAKI